MVAWAIPTTPQDPPMRLRMKRICFRMCHDICMYTHIHIYIDLLFRRQIIIQPSRPDKSCVSWPSGAFRNIWPSNPPNYSKYQRKVWLAEWLAALWVIRFTGCLAFESTRIPQYPGRARLARLRIASFPSYLDVDPRHAAKHGFYSSPGRAYAS